MSKLETASGIAYHPSIHLMELCIDESAENTGLKTLEKAQEA